MNLDRFIVRTMIVNFETTRDAIMSKSRKNKLPVIRQYITYLLRTYTKISNEEICRINGWSEGNSRYNAVDYACQVVSDQFHVNKHFLDERFIYTEQIIRDYIDGKDLPPAQLNRNMETSLIEIYNVCKTSLNKKNMSTKLKEIEDICEKHKE